MMTKEQMTAFAKMAIKPLVLAGSFALTMVLSAIEKKEQEKAINDAVEERFNAFMAENKLEEEETEEESETDEESEDEET